MPSRPDELDVPRLFEHEQAAVGGEFHRRGAAQSGGDCGLGEPGGEGRRGAPPLERLELRQCRPPTATCARRLVPMTAPVLDCRRSPSAETTAPASGPPLMPRTRSQPGAGAGDIPRNGQDCTPSRGADAKLADLNRAAFSPQIPVTKRTIPASQRSTALLSAVSACWTGSAAKQFSRVGLPDREMLWQGWPPSESCNEPAARCASKTSPAAPRRSC